MNADRCAECGHSASAHTPGDDPVSPGVCSACPPDDQHHDLSSTTDRPVSSSGGFTGISLAGRWECGSCGATGDGWYDKDDGLVLHDENGQPFDPDDHVCEGD